MSDVYSFRPGPTYRGANRQEMFDAAMEQPLSITSTLLDQAKGGVLESFGLGTAIRGATLPEAAPVVPGITTDPGDRNFLHGRWETPDELGARRQSMGALDENQYKTSPFFRESVPYDPGMTVTRAAALAAADDARKVREHYAIKRPISAFIGNLGGQALDPINYVPIFGPAVKAAAVSRAGRFAGEVLTAGADAAANTAVFGIGTASERAKFGDDVSWQSTVSQIATAAMIGSAFGAISGAIGRRVDARSMSEAERRLGTLRTTQESRIALNEGIDAIVRGEDIRLSPNSTEPMARVADEIDQKVNVTLPPPVVLSAREALALPPFAPEGIMYHGSPSAKRVDGLKVSEGGELGAGIYVSREPRVAAGYSRGGDQTPHEGVLQINTSAVKLKEITRREYLDDRTALYAEEQAKNGGEWDSSVARAGDRRLIEKYQSEGFDGVYDVQGRQGVIFPTSVPKAALLRQETVASPTIPRTIDTTAARHDPVPEGIKQAEVAVAKPDDAKALAAQYRVDPQTGSFDEEGEVAQLAAEGRLTEEDAATLVQAQADFETGSAYAEALRSVAGCLI